MKKVFNVHVMYRDGSQFIRREVKADNENEVLRIIYNEAVTTGSKVRSVNIVDKEDD